MSGSRRTAPRAAWLLAIAIILPMPLPLFIPTMVAEPNRDAAKQLRYRQELVEFLKAAPGAENRPRGVMLAMSGGGCAAVGPLRLAANGVDMYTVVYNEATIDHFQGLVDVLVAGDPDFIVIQDTVLVVTRPAGRLADRIRDTYRRARTYWRSQVVRSLGMEIGVQNVAAAQETGGEDQALWRCRGWPKERSEWAADVEQNMARIGSYSERRHAEILEFVDIFAQAGIPTIIVSPPTNTYTAGYASRVHEAANALVFAGPAIPNVSLHRQTTDTPSQLFSDPFHLSPEANQSYRDWLNKEILQVLRERSDH